MLQFNTAKQLPKQKVTRLAFILDTSGSMRVRQAEAVRVYNDAMGVIKQAVLHHKDADGLPQDATISLITFADRPEVAFASRGVASIPKLEDRHIQCSGNTALFDAALRGIEQLQSYIEGKQEDVAYLLYVITDGEENHSAPASMGKLRDMLNALNATDKWTICFMLPKGASAAFRSRLPGIPSGNVAEWDTLDTRGLNDAGKQTEASLGQYFATRATGARATRSFFVDTDRLAPSVVKHALTDLSSEFVNLAVDRDSRLDEFVRAKLGRFEKGRAFYQLTPDRSNKVQADKEILIRERGKTAVYAGKEARNLVGLPHDKQVTVRPGKLGNYEVFVQSKSDNRKLSKNSTLLYRIR